MDTEKVHIAPSHIRETLDIYCPMVPASRVKLLPVVRSSPVALRRAVARIGLYLKREMHYDFALFDEKEVDSDPFKAFLFPASGYNYNCHDQMPCIGAACFRTRSWEGGRKVDVLAWIWIHPFHRGKGLVKEAWPEFEREFGVFPLEPPISDAMMRTVFKLRSTAIGPYALPSSHYSDEHRHGPVDESKVQQTMVLLDTDEHTARYFVRAALAQREREQQIAADRAQMDAARQQMSLEMNARFGAGKAELPATATA